MSMTHLFNRNVNILGTEFNVFEEGDMGEEEAGESNATTRHITINKNLPLDTKIETFYHEVVHMILAQGGYDILLAEQEEPFVQFLGMALTQFLSENQPLPVRTK